MDSRPVARVEEILSESVADELVIYDERNRTAHALTALAASVWTLCDGQRTPEQIARELQLDPAIVEQALLELDECALLQDHAPTAMSRRAAVRRLAKAGTAAIIAAPLISTVAIPPATAAASVATCTAVGAPCAAFFPGFGACTGTPSSDTCTEAGGSGCQCQGTSCDDGILNGTCAQIPA